MISLRITDLCKRFGGIIALEDVSMQLKPNQVTAIIGPNGSGKTTLFNAIAGYVSIDGGSIYLEESGSPTWKTIDTLKPHQVAKHGIGVLFQEVNVFQRLTALENVCVGVQSQIGESPWITVFNYYSVKKQEKIVRRKGMELLEFVGLENRSQSLASELSFGQQKLVSFARLLAGNPSVLLLDEPTAGLHAEMINTLSKLLRHLSHEGKTVVVIEHNLELVEQLASVVYLIVGGRVQSFGNTQDVLKRLQSNQTN